MRNILLINRHRSLKFSLLITCFSLLNAVVADEELWIGMPSHELFEELGYPTSSMKLGNREVHFYDGSRKVEIVDNKVQALYGFPPLMIKKVEPPPPPPPVRRPTPPTIDKPIPSRAPSPVQTPEPPQQIAPPQPTPTVGSNSPAVTLTPAATEPQSTTPSIVVTKTVSEPTQTTASRATTQSEKKPPAQATTITAQNSPPKSSVSTSTENGDPEQGGSKGIDLAEIKAFFTSIDLQAIDLQSLDLEPKELIICLAGILVFLFLIACLISLWRSRGIVYQKDKRVGIADAFLPPTLKASNPVKERVKIGEEVYSAIENDDPKYRHTEPDRATLSIRSPRLQREGPQLPVAPLVKTQESEPLPEPSEPQPESRNPQFDSREQEPPVEEDTPTQFSRPDTTPRSSKLRLRSKSEPKHPQLKRRKPIGAPK